VGRSVLLCAIIGRLESGDLVCLWGYGRGK
jgi:hypothetical protein